MFYEKCRECRYVCRCCASHFMDNWPRCSECPNNRIEFTPSYHIVYCPLDGEKISRPLMDINGRLVRGIWSMTDWKIHKKLLDAGGIGPIVYIWPARANNKWYMEQKLVEKFLAEGRTVVYGRPQPNRRKLLGTSLYSLIVDRDMLTPEQYERADRIWNEYWKNKREGE